MSRCAWLKEGIPATTRHVCLMQDRLYRTDVAMQTVGYFHPPQLGETPLSTGGQKESGKR